MQNESTERVELLPTNDYIFKRVLGRKGSEKITEGFIRNFVELENIEVEEVKEDIILEKDLLNDKVGILDILAKTKTESMINLEMQVGNYKFIKDRLLFYACKLLVSEGINKGNNYGGVKKTIAVLIVRDKLDFLEEIKKYHTKWNIREEEYHTKVLTNKLELHIIEIGKIEEKIEKEEIEEKGKLALWTKFLLNPKLLEEKDMEENEDVKMAKEKYEEVISDEEEQRRALRRQIYYMDMASVREEGKDEGRKIGEEKGMKQGREQAKIVIAKKMIENGCDIELIIKCTELSKEEIESLK